MRISRIDPSHIQKAIFSSQKIVEEDLILIDRLGITDWDGKAFNRQLKLQYGEWLVNSDKSLIFISLGGGSCEIPEMYDLVYKDQKIRIWCGGGGDRGVSFQQQDNQYLITVYVTKVQIPSQLWQDTEAIFSLIEQAFAARYIGAQTAGLTIEFNLKAQRS